MHTLDILANIPSTCRVTWMDKPEGIEGTDFIYQPTYSFFNWELMYNYIETDDCFRKRIISFTKG